MFIPPLIRPSRKCPRCGLRYPARKKNCSHCTGLNDRELERLYERREREHQAHQGLSMQMLILAAVLLVIMLVATSA